MIYCRAERLALHSPFGLSKIGCLSGSQPLRLACT
jgi:hypothetical protein